MDVNKLFSINGGGRSDEETKDSRGSSKNRLLDPESDEESERGQAETSADQEQRIREESPFGHLKSWQLLRVIVKANDDVR